MKKILTMILVVGILAGCTAQDTTLAVSGAWARPALAGENSAIYFTIDNPTGEDDTLLAAASPAADMVEVHLSAMNADGTMTMTHQDSVLISQGAQTVFEPGGLHVMLMGLTADLKPGDTIAFTLTFEKAGELSFEAEVKEP